MARSRKKVTLPRGLWSRSPVQKAHSEKGYNRRVAKKKSVREEAGEA